MEGKRFVVHNILRENLEEESAIYYLRMSQTDRVVEFISQFPL